jgi:hypothetical protein
VKDGQTMTNSGSSRICESTWLIGIMRKAFLAACHNRPYYVNAREESHAATKAFSRSFCC